MINKLPDIPYMEGIDGDVSEQWLSCWEMAEHFYHNIPANEKLYRALAAFLAQHLGFKVGNIRADMQMAVLVTLISIKRTKTHSEAALVEAMQRLFEPPKKSIFTRLKNWLRSVFA
jgi:hypothetical protein